MGENRKQPFKVDGLVDAVMDSINLETNEIHLTLLEINLKIGLEDVLEDYTNWLLNNNLLIVDTGSKIVFTKNRIGSEIINNEELVNNFLRNTNNE